MTAITTTNERFGKRIAIRDGERFPQIGETNRAVINTIKQMYEHPAVIFGRWLGISDKTAKRKLGFERALSAEDLGVLIRSEQGFEIVAAIMGDARPKWWRILLPLKDAADAREAQMIARRRLKKTIESAIDADRTLTEAIHRAEALSDQDHAGPHVDALRSMGRVQDRTLAKKK